MISYLQASLVGLHVAIALALLVFFRAEWLRCRPPTPQAACGRSNPPPPARPARPIRESYRGSGNPRLGDARRPPRLLSCREGREAAEERA